MIKLLVKFCLHCERPSDTCRLQGTLRKLHLTEIADKLTITTEYPP